MAKALTNNTGGPKAVNTNKGVVILQPGEALSSDFEVSAEERAAIDACGFLDADSQPQIEPANTQATAAILNNMGAGGPTMGTEGSGPADSLDGKTKAELLEIAEAEGVEGVTDSNSKAEIAEAISAKREAA